MKSFYHLLANTLIAGVTNNFVWFALTFWAYLETQNVIATAVIGGFYMLTSAASGFWFGSIVDHNKKKYVMILSSIISLIMFSLGLLFYSLTPEALFKSIDSVYLWGFAAILMFGVVIGNLRNIALPTVITIIVPEKDRDKANGLSGTIFGIAFAITSVGSGLVLGFSGMMLALILAIIFTALAIGHMLTITVPEKEVVRNAEAKKDIDIKGTIKVIAAIPGLFALIFFTTFNNFLGGVFMALMDPYGLSLMSVQAWGLLWGGLSLGFIVGGLIIAKKGLGKNPLKTLMIANIVMWTASIFFTIQPLIWLLALGMFIWICLVPFAEAAEQTILQKVVPLERQGRVFGFAQSIEQAASPLTAFIIGPVTQLVFIPYMTIGAGVQLLGPYIGVGAGRGIALVFMAAGTIGLVMTLIAINSRPYHRLSKFYSK